MNWIICNIYWNYHFYTQILFYENNYCLIVIKKYESLINPFVLYLIFVSFCGQFRFQRLLNALLYNNTHKNNFTHVTYPYTLGFLISKSIYYEGEGYNNNPLVNPCFGYLRCSMSYLAYTLTSLWPSLHVNVTPKIVSQGTATGKLS